MSGESFRFVHASDLRLDRPPYGMANIPDHLREVMINAPLVAAERIFELALSENVDFVVLSGDIIDPNQAGPQALAFLHEQFQRLADRGIEVFWAGGTCDAPTHWPDEITMPENVNTFPLGSVAIQQFYRGDQPIANILGRSGHGAISAADFLEASEELCSIAVAHGTADVGELTKQGVEYWALGGDHRHQVLSTAPFAVEYSGTTQGRCPDETGQHGCVLCHADLDRNVHTQFVATDVFRWRTERTTLADGQTGQDLKRLLRERMKHVAVEAADRPILVTWIVDGTSEHLADQQRLTRELLIWLRDEFGHTTAPAWTVELQIEPNQTFPEQWCEEDTILGDFLRSVRDHEKDSEASLGLENLLADRPDWAVLAAELQVTDPQTRNEVLRDATAIGTSLLRGDDKALSDSLIPAASSDEQEVPA